MTVWRHTFNLNASELYFKLIPPTNQTPPKPLFLPLEPVLHVCSVLQQETGAASGEVRGALLWRGGGWENYRFCCINYKIVNTFHSGLSDLVRVSIGWQLGDVYEEQIGLCHDEKIFSTIWSNYTLHGASIDFRQNIEDLCFYLISIILISRDIDSSRPSFRWAELV